MSTTTHDKPKPCSEFIRAAASRYILLADDDDMDGKDKRAKVSMDMAAALNATADAYDAILAACENAQALIDCLKSERAVSGYPREWSVVDNELRAAIALAKPVTGNE